MGGAFDGVRARARTEYRTIAAGLDALRIHDGAARAVVRDFCVHVVTDPDYRHAYQLQALPGEEELDFEGHVSVSTRLALWTTPSMSYLAIGGRYPGAVWADLVDGYRVIAQVFPNRIEVRSALMGGRLIRSRVIPFPDAAPRTRAPHPARSVREARLCPSCFTELPATGVCDSCS